MRNLLLLGIAFGLTSAALSQTVIVDNRMGGYAFNSPYNKLYNQSSQITFTGKVTGIQKTVPMRGMAPATTLLVKTSTGGTAVVELGPTWYVENQQTKIRTKDNIQVTGSKVMIDGRGVILAKLIKKNTSVLALRRINGRPYWDISEPVVLNSGVDPNVYEVTGTVEGFRIYGDGADSYAGLSLRTSEGLITVDLGPQWFVGPQQFNFVNGMNLSFATGGTYRVDPYSNPIPAYWVRFGGNTYQFRNNNGTGIWMGG
ncbi:MAG: hypothetical protein H7Y17_00660 [Chlorobia bacterium]|nr:hypothetical protein [Fimbriimonadaceae bacterium]